MVRSNENQQQLDTNRDLVLGQAGEHAELLDWMYQGHLEHWGLDEQWEIVAVEHASETWLRTNTGTRSNFKLKAKVDLVVRWQNKLWIVDHKTCKNLPRDKELDIDDQFGLYTWALRQQDYPVFGSIHNAARTQRNKDQERHPQDLDQRYHRTMLYRTDVELDTLAVEAWRTAKAAYQWPAGEAPRSPNVDTCRWRCPFTEACLMGRKGADEQNILLDTGYEQDFARH